MLELHKALLFKLGLLDRVLAVSGLASCLVAGLALLAFLRTSRGSEPPMGR